MSKILNFFSYHWNTHRFVTRSLLGGRLIRCDRIPRRLPVPEVLREDPLGSQAHCSVIYNGHFLPHSERILVLRDLDSVLVQTIQQLRPLYEVPHRLDHRDRSNVDRSAQLLPLPISRVHP